jgi:hypothetical protein
MIKLVKLSIILFTATTWAQNHAVEGEISTVQENGLYRIHIPHGVRSYATSDLRDLRIWDSQDKQVPYYLEQASYNKSVVIPDLKEFSIISRTSKKDTSSTYIFKNPDKTIAQAVLLISNYEGNKNYKLEGSNDQNQWFGIVNSGYLTQLNQPIQTKLYKAINFPLCSYEYLKIVFDDRNSLPLNLLKIGRDSSITQSGDALLMEKIPVKELQFFQKNKMTIVHFTFDRAEVINQIQIEISGPALYRRNAMLYSLEKRELKREKKAYQQQLARFLIRSDNSLVFDIPKAVEKELYLEIDNKDNPKLQIDGIYLLQKPIYMVAALKKQESYRLTAGDDKLSVPDYDISYAINTIDSVLPKAQISSLVYRHPATAVKSRGSFWQQAWFMWTCIGIAATIISYFAINLLSELKKKEE